MVSNRLSANKLDYRPVRHLPEHIHAGSQMGKRYPVRGIMARGQQTPPDIEDLDPFPFFQSVHIQIIIGGQKTNLSVKPGAEPNEVRAMPRRRTERSEFMNTLELFAP